MIKDQMESIYRDTPLNMIPWHWERIPDLLKQTVTAKKVQPCRAIDLGCGTGNYAIFFASRTFEMTGVDISPTAIEIAKKSAEQKGVPCQFIVTDVLGLMREVEGTFDFAYDWELLHHIHPQDRLKYIHNIHRLLNPEGHYLSLCFSEASTQFGGAGKFRRTPLGTLLYFSSEKEMIALYDPLFNIIKLETVEIRGKNGTHKAIYAFLKKK